MNNIFHSGFTTLIGRSNVGKSTLMNTLTGIKIAAVTNKPQTTRNIIHGVINYPQGQAVLVDTPGILREKKSPLAGKLLRRAKEALENIDLILYLVDPTKSLGEEERYVMSLVKKINIPKILIINKSDLPSRDKIYLEDYRQLGTEFNQTFELSALKNKHVKPLRDAIFSFLPEGEAIYPESQLTNLNEKEWIREIIREKAFNALWQEVPYTLHVAVRDIENKPDIMVISAAIIVGDRRYKKMIVGRGGQMIKQIGSMARKELEIALNKKIYLDLEVESNLRWDESV
jgi:GTP-binding protein Era